MTPDEKLWAAEAAIRALVKGRFGVDTVDFHYGVGGYPLVVVSDDARALVVVPMDGAHVLADGASMLPSDRILLARSIETAPRLA